VTIFSTFAWVILKQWSFNVGIYLNMEFLHRPVL
jgi:hypothetical protein